MVREFLYRGKKLDELKQMEPKEFVKLLPSRQRRSILRGFNQEQKVLLEKVKKTNEGKYKKKIRTQSRDMVILPIIINLPIEIYNGKEYVRVDIQPEMIGKYLGELVLTRKKLTHSAPGVGATKSSAAASVK